jgi:hypothetical protein
MDYVQALLESAPSTASMTRRQIALLDIRIEYGSPAGTTNPPRSSSSYIYFLERVCLSKQNRFINRTLDIRLFNPVKIFSENKGVT